MAQLGQCPLCGKRKWISRECRCVLQRYRDGAQQRHPAAQMRRAARKKKLRPLLLLCGSIAVWTVVLVVIGDAVAAEQAGPVWRLIVPGIASVLGGWMRTGYDYEDGVDIWKMIWVPFPFDWQEHWERFRNMWLTMDRPIFKGFYIAAIIAIWIGFLRLPGLQKAIEAL
jgi:hypothetical protein